MNNDLDFNVLERAIQTVAPQWAMNRARARAVTALAVRHFEAAQVGRRTDGWKRAGTDANTANGRALGTLRNLSRDLVRNNAWARRGKQIVSNNTVGWGIVPKPTNSGVNAAKRARALWLDWAGSKQCDYTGQRDFYGLQRLIMSTVAESGEALIRYYPRPLSDRLAIPMQIQVLEPDHIDTSRDGIKTAGGGKIIQGVEFDAKGRRVAYWLFPEHPGGNNLMGSRTLSTAQRVPASDVDHVYYVERPGQVRGVTWFASVLVRLKDYDEYEDATLLRQKIAACFAAFVTDTDGSNLPLGTPSATNPLVETIEPGMIHSLPIGKSVEFASPPVVTDGKFDERMLRAAAAGLGVTYEDLTGDYRGMSFSSSRMSRIAHWANVHDWRYNMIIPMFCDPAWKRAMGIAFIAGLIPEQPSAAWTPPPMPMIEPDKEGLAYIRLIRAGAMNFDDMVREQGNDPDTYWAERAAQQQRLDDLKIVLDSDARYTSQAGNAQAADEPAAPAKAAEN